MSFCSICQESELVEPVLTSCTHTYCWPHLYEAVRSSGDFKCPLCRLIVTRVSPLPGGLARSADLDIPECPASAEHFPFLSLQECVMESSVRRSSRTRTPATFFDDLPDIAYTPQQRLRPDTSTSDQEEHPQGNIPSRVRFQPPLQARMDQVTLNSLSTYGRRIIQNLPESHRSGEQLEENQVHHRGLGERREVLEVKKSRKRKGQELSLVEPTLPEASDVETIPMGNSSRGSASTRGFSSRVSGSNRGDSSRGGGSTKSFSSRGGGFSREDYSRAGRGLSGRGRSSGTGRGGRVGANREDSASRGTARGRLRPGRGGKAHQREIEELFTDEEEAVEEEEEAAEHEETAGPVNGHLRAGANDHHMAGQHGRAVEGHPGSGVGRGDILERIEPEVDIADDGNEEAYIYPDTLVPGTRKTYQEILVEGLRDYSIEKQIHHTKVTWSNVVGFIRELYPQAWEGKVPGQVGKRIKTNWTRIAKQRREKKAFVKGSGISGPKLTALERAVDEILEFNSPEQQVDVEDGQYMNNRNSSSLQNRKMSAADKKRAGQLLREKAMENVGPTRSRDPRIDSSLTETLASFRTDVQRGLVDHGNRSKIMMDNMEEVYKQRQEDQVKAQEEKERKERNAMMTQTMQVAQMAVMSKLVSSLTGEAVPGNFGLGRAGLGEAGLGAAGLGAAGLGGAGLGGAGLDAGEQSQTSATDTQRKKVTLHYGIEGDSDQYPLESHLTNFVDLKESLQSLMLLRKDRPITVILDHKQVLVNIEKLKNGSEYRVTEKEKENFVRIFLDEI